MRIAVCIKQVPEGEGGGMDPEQGVLIRKGATRMNPLDRYALETGLRLAGENGETIAFTMGPSTAEAVLREALAMGVDKGVLVSDHGFAGSDVFATSYTLSGAIRLFGDFDAVICGKQTTDGDTAQVGSALAAWLGWEYLGCVASVSYEAGHKMVGVRQLGSGILYGVEAGCPFVMSVERDIFVPRIPTLRMRLMAGKKDISVVNLSNMKDPCPEHYGIKGSPTRVVKIYRPKPEKRGRVEPMDGASGAAALGRIIKERMENKGIPACPGDRRNLGTVDAGAVLSPAGLISSRDKKQEKTAGGWKGILVYLQTDENGNLLPVGLELADKASRLSRGTREEVYGLVITGQMKDIYSHIPGIGKLFVVLGEQYRLFSHTVFTEALIRCIIRCRPLAVLLGATPEGRSMAPAAAVRFGTGVTADCTELRMDGEKLVQIRPAFGGNVMAEIITPDARPQMATVRPGIMARADEAVSTGNPVEIINITDTVASHGPMSRVTGTFPIETATIGNGEFVVVAGGGMGSRQDVERLRQWAEGNGAVLGCSRKVAERGWLPGERQIGLSGSTVWPKLLITFGVSGSVQFLAGIARAEYVVAVDCDGEAPIFGRANMGIRADLHEVLSELEKAGC